MIVNQLLILLSELSSKIRKEKRGELLVKVIIDADDFGMSEAINHGIIKSYVDGLTTSTLLCQFTNSRTCRCVSKKLSRLICRSAYEFFIRETLCGPMYDSFTGR